MKNRIAAAVALAFSTFAPLGSAATYVYTFNDMTYVPDQAWNTVNTAAYWENRGTDRWGFVWTTPLTFSTTFPSGGGGGHFHIGYQGQYECFVNTQPGHFVNNVCVANDVWTNRGPFVTHSATSTLFFQLVTNSSAMVPFVAKKIVM